MDILTGLIVVGAIAVAAYFVISNIRKRKGGTGGKYSGDSDRKRKF